MILNIPIYINTNVDTHIQDGYLTENRSLYLFSPGRIPFIRVYAYPRCLYTLKREAGSGATIQSEGSRA